MKQLTLLPGHFTEAAQTRDWTGVPPRAAIDRWLTQPGGRAYAERSHIQYAAMLCAVSQWWAKERSGVNFLNAGAADVTAFLLTRGRQPRGASHVERPEQGSPATQTRRLYLSLMRRLFAHLVAIRLRDTNPVEELWASRGLDGHQRAVPKYLSSGQDQAYIDWVRRQPLRGWRDVRDRALRLIFLASGITLSEAQRLNVQDIRIKRNANADSTASAAERRVGADLVIAGHGSVDEHVTSIAAWAMEEITAWLDVRPRAIAELDLPAHATVVFLTLEPRGHQARPVRPLCSPEIFNIIRPGLEHVLGPTAVRMGPQTLRNTFAVRNLLAGRKPETVRTWMGLKTNFSIVRLQEQIVGNDSDEAV